MDANRFEALVYAQAARGVVFATIAFVQRYETRLETTSIIPSGSVEETLLKTRSAKPTISPKTYLYKVPVGMELRPGDLVIAQVFTEEFSIGQVISLSTEPPSIEEYDYAKSMKWIVGKLDREFSEGLTRADANLLKSLTRVTLSSRMQQISQTLGVNLLDLNVGGISMPALTGPSSSEGEAS